MRKVQTAALRRKLMTGRVDLDALPARRALAALAAADQVIDKAVAGAVPWRDAAAQVILARGAVTDALAAIDDSKGVRRRAAEKLAGERVVRNRR